MSPNVARIQRDKHIATQSHASSRKFTIRENEFIKFFEMDFANGRCTFRFWHKCNLERVSDCEEKRIWYAYEVAVFYITHYQAAIVDFRWSKNKKKKTHQPVINNKLISKTVCVRNSGRAHNQCSKMMKKTIISNKVQEFRILRNMRQAWQLLSFVH